MTQEVKQWARRAVRDNPLTLYTEEELSKMAPPEWLIEGIVPKRSMVTIYGPPGSGKSFLALDFAMSVATGFDFFGSRAEPGVVVYLAMEAITGIPKRIRAWRESRQVGWNADILFSSEFQSLMTIDSVESLISGLQEQLPFDANPAMVIFDTLGLACVGADENDAADMNRVMKHAKILTDQLDPCTVVFIHHTSKGKNTERGSTAIRGACDTMISVYQKEGRVSVQVSKQRDFEASDVMHFGLDKFGDSAALVPRATATPQEALPKEMNPFAQQVLEKIQGDMTFADIQQQFPDVLMQKLARAVSTLNSFGKITISETKPRIYRRK